MGSQIRVELVAVEVVGDDGGAAGGQGVERVAAGKQEGDRADRVLAFEIERLSVDRHRRDAIAVRLGRVKGVLYVPRQAQFEHGPRVLGIEVGLPLLLEGLLEVRPRNRHIPQLVGEGLDGEGLTVSDVSVRRRDEVGAQPSGVDGADVHRLAFLRDHSLLKGVRGEVAERGLDAAVGTGVGRLAVR